MRDPVIWWVRKDLRLSDNPALAAALEAGGPVIPQGYFFVGPVIGTR